MTASPVLTPNRVRSAGQPRGSNSRVSLSDRSRQRKAARQVLAAWSSSIPGAQRHHGIADIFVDRAAGAHQFTGRDDGAMKFAAADAILLSSGVPSVACDHRRLGVLEGDSWLTRNTTPLTKP